MGIYSFCFVLALCPCDASDNHSQLMEWWICWWREVNKIQSKISHIESASRVKKLFNPFLDYDFFYILFVARIIIAKSYAKTLIDMRDRL